MKKEVVLGKKSLQFYYFRYKDSPYYSLGIAVITVIACLLLLSQIIFPQMSRWFSLREEVIVVREKVSTIRENINYMNNVDKSIINKQLQISTNALPPEKDFGQVMSAISAAALDSGVALEDYGFQVGSLASTSGKLNNITSNSLISMLLTVSLRGDLPRIEFFLKSLQEKLPLSEVVNINGSGDAVSVDIQFYYKKFPPIQYKDDVKIVPISDTERNLLNSMSSWQVTKSIQESRSVNSNVPLF